MKVRNCDTAKSQAQSLRAIDQEAAEVSSSQLGDLSSSWCTLDSFKPISMKEANKYLLVHKVTQSSPSTAMRFVAKVPQDEQNSYIVAFSSGDGTPKSDNEPTSSKTIRDVHISMRLVEDFLHLAKENTEKDLETCGILGAVLEREILYMTTLIIPKQESASNSCQATNEEEVFTILNERSLVPVGWIHLNTGAEGQPIYQTGGRATLFKFFAFTFQREDGILLYPMLLYMRSVTAIPPAVDLHTQYSYQAMIPEAFAIVLAPTDTSRSWGLFRLTDPDGMTILKNCEEKGFHPHKEPDNGNPVYEHCSNVYKNSNLRFEIFDLR